MSLRAHQYDRMISLPGSAPLESVRSRAPSRALGDGGGAASPRQGTGGAPRSEGCIQPYIDAQEPADSATVAGRIDLDERRRWRALPLAAIHIASVKKYAPHTFCDGCCETRRRGGTKVGSRRLRPGARGWVRRGGPHRARRREPGHPRVRLRSDLHAVERLRRCRGRHAVLHHLSERRGEPRRALGLPAGARLASCVMHAGRPAMRGSGLQRRRPRGVLGRHVRLRAMQRHVLSRRGRRSRCEQRLRFNGGPRGCRDLRPVVGGPPPARRSGRGEPRAKRWCARDGLARPWASVRVLHDVGIGGASSAFASAPRQRPPALVVTDGVFVDSEGGRPPDPLARARDPTFDFVA